MYPGVLNPRVERFGGPRRGLAAFDVPGVAAAPAVLRARRR
jgi:hypothetical protein